ncbi:ovomucoid-like [Monodelphis domestica]|uniref:ovomucoid-like n=1 Tax=Monodelphis domestica TaxID=13616 RepID=UPI00028BC8E0|nr:ovomucoid-like [Monodelphis domestica]
MKAAAVCLFLMLTLMSTFNVESISANTVDCSNPKQSPAADLRLCTMEYNPMCGSNGETYSNKCLFCSAVRKSNDKIKFAHMGEC